MRQHVPNVKSLAVVVDNDNQSKLISPNIKNSKLPDLIDLSSEHFSKVIEALPF